MSQTSHLSELSKVSFCVVLSYVLWGISCISHPTELLSSLKSTVADCGIKMCISSHVKKTRLSSVVKPVSLGYRLTYAFANLREILIPIIFVTNIIYVLEVSFAVPPPASNNGGEKLTFKIKPQINILVSWACMKTNYCLVGLSKKRVVKTSKPGKTNAYCGFHRLVGLQPYLGRTSSARGSLKCFRGLFGLLCLFFKLLCFNCR